MDLEKALTSPAHLRERQQEIPGRHLPEAAQQNRRRLRQRSQTVFVVLGVADMHALTRGIDIADSKTQASTETQAKTALGKNRRPDNSGLVLALEIRIR